MPVTWPSAWPFWSSTFAEAAPAGGDDRLFSATGAISSAQASAGAPINTAHRIKVRKQDMWEPFWVAQLQRDLGLPVSGAGDYSAACGNGSEPSNCGSGMAVSHSIALVRRART